MMDEIKTLAETFRGAIDGIKAEDGFLRDAPFDRFPTGCCGDTSDLMAQFLIDHGIESWYVCGTYYPNSEQEDAFEGIRSHAWLTTDDPRITKNYCIIDLTGDQFQAYPEFYYYNQAAYVGTLDPFHRLFRVTDCDVSKHEGLDSFGYVAALRLWGLYKKILQKLLIK